MNVALYRVGRDRWAMTERGRADLSRSPTEISIGTSAMRWDGAQLLLEIDEWTAPLPSRIRGTVKLHTQTINTQAFNLDENARHHWRPIAPHARVEACFDDGELAWSGDAYLDSNWGSEPLEHAFRGWNWSRAHVRDGTHVHYDVNPRSGADRSLSIKFDRSGEAQTIDAPPWSPLPPTFWCVPRSARASADAQLRLIRTLEDAPFYSRSQLTGVIAGDATDIVHESLSLDRFRMPIVRAMLPFRMPRIVLRR